MSLRPTNLNSAMDDLSVIRSILERTAPSFRPLAPSFLRAGAVWLVLSLVWQREKATKALPRLPRMVLSVWQALLLLTLVFHVLTEVALQTNSSGISYAGEVSGFDLALMASWAYQWVAPLLFPLLPLLVTSAILEDAPLRWLGLAILALLLGYLALCLFTPDSGTVMVAFSVILSLSRDFLPPIALLLTAHRLKKLPEGA